MTDAPTRPTPLLRPRLLHDGFTDELIEAARRRSSWQLIRPGAHVATDEWDPLAADERHRLLIAATLPRLGSDTVVSHLSAARLHRLPVGRRELSEVVHVTRNRRAGGYRKGWVHAHTGIVDPAAVTVIEGIPVTTAARTLVDAACLLELPAAVAMMDDGLHRGIATATDIGEALRVQAGRAGISLARSSVGLADGRSESVGESLSRLLIRDFGVPTPELQYDVRDERGHVVARSDFAWPEQRTVGEFDGRIKYSRLVRPGETPADVVWREKKREDRIRDLGWEVVRWTWVDLADGSQLARRILRALDRGSRR